MADSIVPIIMRGFRSGVRLSRQSIPRTTWHQVIAINLTGVWLCMKYEIPQMLTQGGGTIVNTASVGVGRAPGASAYVASKHGVVGLTKTAALEYARQGIRVNCCLSRRHSDADDRKRLERIPSTEARILPRQPMGRVGTPEEVAEAVVWLCSDAASFVTGHTMTVDGGYVAQ